MCCRARPTGITTSARPTGTWRATRFSSAGRGRTGSVPPLRRGGVAARGHRTLAHGQRHPDAHGEATVGPQHDLGHAPQSPAYQGTACFQKTAMTPRGSARPPNAVEIATPALRLSPSGCTRRVRMMTEAEREPSSQRATSHETGGIPVSQWRESLDYVLRARPGHIFV